MYLKAPVSLGQGILCYAHSRPPLEHSRTDFVTPCKACYHHTKGIRGECNLIAATRGEDYVSPLRLRPTALAMSAGALHKQTYG